MTKKAGGITLPYFKLNFKTTVIKIVWYWPKTRQQSPEINPHIYGQRMLDRGANTHQWGKDSLFNKWCWKIWISTFKIMKLVPCLTSLKNFI